MAAAPQLELVTIWINDQEIQVPKGELIVESVKRLGLEIPIFCYHPRMKPVGMCRMCLVEVGYRQPDGSVRKMPKPQAGCTLPAGEGMVVYTDSEMVHRDRKGVLEFLLINHPLDCPICDRGGECPLQNNTIFYGPSTSRFTELKRHAQKAFPLSEYVTLDLERCIQCGRCVRFTEEISGDGQLAFRFRGAQMQPSTFALTSFESKFSGNTIEICPVGALTSAKYRFRARPWDLETKPAQCLECSNHCSVHFDYRASKFVRISGRTNEEVNEEWTCDRGKFGHDYYNSDQRLTQVLIRTGRQFEAASWTEAYEVILKEFSVGGENVAMLAGGRTSNEGLYLAQRLMRESFGSGNLDHRWRRTLPSDSERVDSRLGVSEVQVSLPDLEQARSIVVFGGSLADEQPIVYLRVRKAAVQKGVPVFSVTSASTEVSQFAEQELVYRSGRELDAASLMLDAARKNGSQVSALESEGMSGLTAEEIAPVIAAILDGATVLVSESIYDSAEGVRVVTALAELAKLSGGKFWLMNTHGNSRGADWMGMLPDRGAGGAKLKSGGLNTMEILRKAADFELKALWLLDVDPFELCADRLLVQSALENVDFLVVQGCVESEAVGYASVVLPSAAPAEQSGSYVNVEGRFQEIQQILPAPGDAKAAWRVFAELLLRTQPGAPYFGVSEVRAELAQTTGNRLQAGELVKSAAKVSPA